MNPEHPRATREIVADYLTWQIIVNDGESILEARHRISFWDALVVPAAQSSCAKILYLEDLCDRHRYESVQVVNPLRRGA
jgi:predicted nucleic acid-binding protein